MATPHRTALCRNIQGSRDAFQSPLLRSSPDNAKGSFRKFLVNFCKSTQSKFKTLPVEQPAEAEEANWAAFRERKAIQFSQVSSGQSCFRKHSDMRDPKARALLAVSSVFARTSAARLAVIRTSGSISPSIRIKRSAELEDGPFQLRNDPNDGGRFSPPPSGPQMNGAGNKDSRLGFQCAPKR